MKNFELKKDIIYKKLRDGIFSGEYPENSKFPKELEFSKLLGVGKVTLRSALEKLEEEGLVARIPSKGTFVLSLKSNKNKTKRILVITTLLDRLDSQNRYILPEITNTVNKLGYQMDLCDLAYIEANTEEELSNSLREKNIYGIIAMLNNFLGDEPIISKLKATNLPIVLPHARKHDTPNTGFASVMVTEKEAWRDSVKYLQKQGHTRIGTITNSKNHFRNHNREEHLKLLETFGFSQDERLIKSSRYDTQDISDVVDDWLNMTMGPTAILCFSSSYAVSVCNSLKSKGIRIPEDIAVLGCGGLPGGEYLTPSLSVTDFEFSTAGRLAVELLVRSAEWFGLKGTAIPQVFHSHKLILRESTNIKRLEKNFSEIN